MVVVCWHVQDQLPACCRYVMMDETDAAKELGVDMEADTITCEVPFGGVLFLNNIIPHRCRAMPQRIRNHVQVIMNACNYTNTDNAAEHSRFSTRLTVPCDAVGCNKCQCWRGNVTPCP